MDIGEMAELTARLKNIIGDPTILAIDEKVIMMRLATELVKRQGANETQTEVIIDNVFWRNRP